MQELKARSVQRELEKRKRKRQKTMQRLKPQKRKTLAEMAQQQHKERKLGWVMMTDRKKHLLLNGGKKLKEQRKRGMREQIQWEMKMQMRKQ